MATNLATKNIAEGEKKIKALLTDFPNVSDPASRFHRLQRSKQSYDLDEGPPPEPKRHQRPGVQQGTVQGLLRNESEDDSLLNRKMEREDRFYGKLIASPSSFLSSIHSSIHLSI